MVLTIIDCSDSLKALVESSAVLWWQVAKKKALTEVSAFFMLVPVGGLEPPHPKATDFESVVSTNSTILALKKVRRILGDF